MATTDKTLIVNDEMTDLINGLGAGDYKRGIQWINNAVRGRAGITNIMPIPFSQAITGGGADDSMEIEVHQPWALSAIELNATDLELITVKLKVNGELLLPRGVTGSAVQSGINLNLADALQRQDLIIAGDAGAKVSFVWNKASVGADTLTGVLYLLDLNFHII